ncbi:MAG: type II toxin-antitoxin system HicA family toxin [Deltaproteobacteria bacterium]|nr:type II toxin-antitoxin system HicA family toxin [Deltaproteobacteria bacterium]
MSRKTLEKILGGVSDKNIRFDESRNILLGFKFAERVKGGHHIFNRFDVQEIVNLQPLKDGKAKAYQVKQVRDLL